MISTKFKNILVPLDGSKNSMRGLDTAIGLARQSHAKLVGICVLQRPPHPAFRSARSVQYPEKQILQNAQDIMDFAEKHCAQNGILFEKKITFGDPGHMIVKFAKDKGFDLIVIGARGIGAVKEIFFGSVSNYVLHKATIPVLVVK
ncbi:MAG: universal stress protein [Candidatus Nitrosotenuis sp.]|uniref:Universal stress protein n=1 Tax=Candidatus Nitrosotenuis uzonensis TaxID=1407055 RepID=V6AUX7_9ARCH|nr:universal stress protein [Candidatus Nitrosotenuis uzonensis]CAE6487447.1 Universal stress protein [Candidatus Nitrosotenuis uzonensis]CDI06360.1 Universal stress protein [Candidatus Nitrosotenuis uzonensis]